MALSFTPLSAPQATDLKRLPYSFIDWLRILRNTLNEAVATLLGFNTMLGLGLSGGTTVLTEAEYRAHFIHVNSSPAATIVFPDSLIKDFIIWNQSAFALTVKTVTGVGLTIGAGKHALVYAFLGDVYRVTADN